MYDMIWNPFLEGYHYRGLRFISLQVFSKIIIHDIQIEYIYSKL